MRNRLWGLWRDEEGAVGVEYALMLAVLGVGMIAGLVGAFERAGHAATHFGQGIAGPSETSAVVGVVGK